MAIEHPRIAVVGCGALGSFYGARLCRAGHEVHFLLRTDFEAVARHGVRVVDAAGGFVVRPRAARDPAEIGVADLVLIGLKTTANDAFERLLSPLVGSATAVLTLQNGLGNEEALAAIFGPAPILGGLCFVCLNRTDPGVIHHLAHGRIVMGEYARPALERTRVIAGLFRAAEVPCEVTDHLEQAHWQKLVWNIPFNGLGVASAAGLESVLAGRLLNPDRLGPCLTTDQLLGDPDWSRLVRELMEETMIAARAHGFDLPDRVADEQIQRTREMGPYRASTLIDFERGQPLELESLFGEPLRRARSVGTRPHRLEALYQLLSALDTARSRGGSQ